MMFTKKNLDLLVAVVVMLGAVNWGAVAYMDTDLVKKVSPNPDVEKIIKGLVGVAGLVALYNLVAPML